MTSNSLLQFAIFLGALLVLAKPLGEYMGRVFQQESTFLDPVLRPVERGIYRLAGIAPDDRMDWKAYAWAMLLFSLLSFAFLVALQRLQHLLPFNPIHLGPVPWGIALNTAVSFVTNTNWQGYGGETTMSYLTQMLALTVQNFLSAASGMAVLVAMTRGFARTKTQTIGNFWTDLVRGTLYILLPLSVLFAAGPGLAGRAPDLQAQRDRPAAAGTADANNKPVTEQVIAVGPVASQEAIKMLGTNGGGFFNVNSAHPFENPTPLTNFLEMVAILLIAAALCYTFGSMVGDRRQGWALLAAMTVIFVPFLRSAWPASRAATPPWPSSAPTRRPSAAAVRRQHGRQGGPLRHRRLRHLGHRHHRRLQRLGQRHARLLHPPGRLGPHGPDPARRGGLRRRGLGPLRHADLRHDRGVHRRAHGRPHAGIPGQEDRGLRDEDGLHADPDRRLPRSWSARPSPCW